MEIMGHAEVIGELPRVGEPVAELVEPERRFAEKYSDGRFRDDEGHAWLQGAPEKIVS